MAFETKQCSGRRREVLGEKARRRKSVEREREREREKVRTRSESLSPFERMIEKEEGEKMCHFLSAKHL